MQGQRRAAWEAVHGAADTTVAGSVRDDREGDAAASPSGSDAEASDVDGVYLSPSGASRMTLLPLKYGYTGLVTRIDSRVLQQNVSPYCTARGES